MYCSNCGADIQQGAKFCVGCGGQIMYELMQHETKPIKQFNGIYKYKGKNKIEVYCPRCKSENCAHFQEHIVIPGKSKKKTTLNLNPLKPFTVFNHKEKVIKKQRIVAESKFICNECGKIFE